jgi:hypothetical protein
VLFFLSGFVLVFVLKRYRYLSPQKQINLFLLIKLSKMLVWGTVALVYILVLKVAIKPFVLIFGTFYLILMAFETFYFYNIEKTNRQES